MSSIVNTPVERRNLSIDQGAQTLGVGKTSVYALIRKGELRAIRIGDRQLIPVEEIERFIATKLATDSVA